MMRSPTLRLLVAVYLSSCLHHVTDGHVTWCVDDESYDGHEVALKYLDVDEIREPQLDALIQDAFARLRCQSLTFQENLTCTECLRAKDVYEILDVTSGSVLSPLQFQNASTIVTTYLYRLHDACAANSDLNWTQVTYDDFTRQLLSIPDDVSGGAAGNSSTADEGGHFFTEHQLESMLRMISTQYIPGENFTKTSSSSSSSSSSSGCGLNADVQELCAFGNIKAFSSMDVLTYTSPKSHELGIHEQELGVMSSIVFTKLLLGECISRVDEGFPVAEDFVKSLFQANSEENNCLLDVHGIESIALALNIGGSSDDHVHDHGSLQGSASGSRKKRDAQDDHHDHDHDHDHEIDVKTQCFSVEDLLTSFGFDPERAQLTKTDFHRLCPSLVQQATQGCLAASTEQKTRPSAAEVYGYGTASVLVTSLCALLGLLIVPLRKKKSYKYLMTVMLGLGVGALTSDALLHLIPQALGLHDHSAEGGSSHSAGEIPSYVWKMLCACAAVWAYYVLQLGLISLGNLSLNKQASVSESLPNKAGNFNSALSVDEETGNGRRDTAEVDDTEKKNKKEKEEMAEEDPDYSLDGHSLSDHGSKARIQDDDVISLHVHAHSSVAWMVTIGDGLHNFADGMAIGAAYSVNWQTGLSTTIAVLTHELPHEFGDVAVLLSTGWSARKVLVFQLVAQSLAFVGLYIGIAVAEQAEGAQEWIFAVTAGIFLFVALADVIPELVEFYNVYSKLHVFLLSNAGILLGYLCLLLLAIFEDDISIS